MSTVLIAGASRGVGLELVKQYASNGDDVIACVRDTGAASLLDEVASGADNVSIQQMDVADPASIEAAAAAIGDRPIDTLIISAGTVGGGRQSLDDLDIEEWHRTLDINTIGPTLVAKAFKPNLVASGNGNLMIMSSQLAASTWPMGGMFIYSSTKAGVGKVGQILALDWAADPVTVTVLHPGWVQTDMGGPSADITAEESASGVRTLVARLTKADSGKFFKWNGEIHPW